MKIKKSRLQEIIKEEIQKIIEGKDEMQSWADSVVSLLKRHTVKAAGKPVKFKKIRIEEANKYLTVVKGEVTVAGIIIEVSFWYQEAGKPELEVVFESPQKRNAYFTKKASGKNANPQNAIKIMDNMFAIKWGR